MASAVYISLGSTCSVAIQGQKLNQRVQAYPFDWQRTDDLDNISDAIENKFDGYISSVIKKNDSNKFPYMTDDVFPQTNNSTIKSIIMQNKYGIKFYHDFSSDISVDDVNQKYQRRIIRFYDTIKSTNKVFFIRDELKPKKISSDRIDRFMSLITKINPNCQFQMILIIHNPEKKALDILNYKNNNVTILNDTCEFGDWTRPNVDWKNIFNS